MKRLLCLLVVLCGTPVLAQESKVTVPYEGLSVYDELPDYVYAMPAKVYQKWAALQNKGAYRESQRIADVFRQRNPFRETYVQSNDYDANVKQKQHEKVSPTSASFSGEQQTRYRGSGMQRTYRHGEGEGVLPVSIINPFAPRPAKVLLKDDGTVYVADPDKVLKSQEEAEQLINDYLNDAS